MGDLSYIFGPDPADRPERLSSCLISKIMLENSKKPDGARIWWESVHERLWNGALSQAGEDYLWANSEDADKVKTYAALAPDEKLALVRRLWFRTFIATENTDNTRNVAASNTGSNLRATESSTLSAAMDWSRAIARK